MDVDVSTAAHLGEHLDQVHDQDHVHVQVHDHGAERVRSIRAEPTRA